MSSSTSDFLVMAIMFRVEVLKGSINSVSHGSFEVSEEQAGNASSNAKGHSDDEHDADRIGFCLPKCGHAGGDDRCRGTGDLRQSSDVVCGNALDECGNIGCCETGLLGHLANIGWDLVGKTRLQCRRVGGSEDSGANGASRVGDRSCGGDQVVRYRAVGAYDDEDERRSKAESSKPGEDDSPRAISGVGLQRGEADDAGSIDEEAHKHWFAHRSKSTAGPSIHHGRKAGANPEGHLTRDNLEWVLLIEPAGTMATSANVQMTIEQGK